MDSIYWFFIGVLILISFIGIVYPIIPSVLFLVFAFLLYGLLFTFESYTWLFWTIQTLFVLMLIGADYLATYFGIKKYGGTKAAIWGSTIGLLIGPFIIPLFGIIIGPFVGAILGEVIVNKSKLNPAVKIGFGSVVGFFSGMLMKSVIQVVMVIVFLKYVL